MEVMKKLPTGRRVYSKLANEAGDTLCNFLGSRNGFQLLSDTWKPNAAGKVERWITAHKIKGTSLRTDCSEKQETFNRTGGRTLRQI